MMSTGGLLQPDDSPCTNNYCCQAFPEGCSCNTDGDCPRGEFCVDCNCNKFPKGCDCQSESDCPNGQFCNNCQCSSFPPGCDCNGDSDCPNDGFCVDCQCRHGCQMAIARF